VGSRLIGSMRGPTELVLVRHGESVGNLADAEARSRGAERLELSARDADVELSDEGREQAAAVGRWMAGLEQDALPTLVLSSPYRRAAETAHRAIEETGVDLVLDERLRERDLGLLDGLTSTGIKAMYPDEAERRKKLGKFYYQPPSGESWADVALRVRSLLADLREGYDGTRVWLFTHQAVIMSFRYVLEGLDEEHLLEIDRSTPIANASVTTFRRTDEGLELVSFADTEAVDRSSADRTHEPAHAGRGTDAEV
jgi:broad specificity phosphatase PhoE